MVRAMQYIYIYIIIDKTSAKRNKRNELIFLIPRLVRSTPLRVESSSLLGAPGRVHSAAVCAGLEINEIAQEITEYQY